MQQAARRKAKAAVVVNPMRKGSGKKQRQAPKRHEKADTIVALADSGANNAAISAETGVSQRQVRHVVEEETLRREGAQIDPNTLSLTAQQKLDAAIKKHKRSLDIEFEQRVQAEIQRRLEATILPRYKKTNDEYQRVLKARKGVMDRATYKKILSCLHPEPRGCLAGAALRRGIQPLHEAGGDASQ